MLFQSQQLQPFLHGIIATQMQENGLALSRFPLNYCDFVDDFQSYAATSAGVHLAFETDAKQVCLSCATVQICDRMIPSVFDIYINDVLQHRVPAAELGAQKICFELSRLSRVEIWFPINAAFYIELLELKNATVCKPITHTKKCLFIGDSITQGFACEYPSLTIAASISRALDLELLNQGIGGYSHRRGFLQRLNFTPDFIIVALGTNDPSWTAPEKRDVDGFYDDLDALYPDTKTVVITPYYRDLPFDAEKMDEVIGRICARAAARKDCLLIDGKTVSPHSKDFYYDGLHPNTGGMQFIAVQLLEKLKEFAF